MFSQSVTGITHDAALPALAEVLNTERLVPLLGQAAGLDLGDHQGLSCVAEVLNHKLGRRCTIRFTLTCVGARGRPRSLVTVIGKVYEKPLLANRLYLRTQHLRNGPFCDSGPLCVPAPMMLVQDWGLVLQEHVDGTDLRNVLSLDAGDRPLTLAGLWLARLHSAPAPPELKATSVQRELEKVDRWCDHVSPCLLTAGAQRLRRAQNVLHRLSRAIAPCTPVLIHKDYYYGNLLWDGERVWGLDFDELAIGDPTLDVAHFLAHLEALAYRTTGRVDEFAPAAAPFLGSYLANTSRDVESRLPLYKAYAFLKLAATEASRKNGNWERISQALADLTCLEAERALDGARIA